MTIYVIRWIDDDGYSTFISADKKSANDWLNTFNTLTFTNKREANKYIKSITDTCNRLKNQFSVVTWEQARQILSEDILIQRLERAI